MKIIIRILTLLLLMFPILVFSQKKEVKRINQPTSKEILHYTNNISRYWRAAKHDTAITYANKLMEVYPKMLIDKVHGQLVLDINRNNKEASKFLTKLYLTNNDKINEIIEPAYIWNKIRSTQSKDSIISLFNDLRINLKNGILTNNYSEKYYLKVLKELNKRGIKVVKDDKKLCENIINTLENKLVEIKALKNNEINKKRAYIRSILSYTHYFLYSISDDEKWLKSASFYSPDMLDKQNKRGYISTLRFLTNETNDLDFQKHYIDYLVENNRKDEALKQMSILTIEEPTNQNMKELRLLFLEVNPLKDFKKYWKNIFSYDAKKFPQLSFKTLRGVNINSKDFSGKWVFIDFWGTWCRPCLSELPEIEKFHKESIALYNNKLKVITISFNSKDLEAFMKSNDYSFPVVEISEEVRKKIGIHSFPTKILISPNGSFRIIPSGFKVNWIEYIDNYCLINKTY